MAHMPVGRGSGLANDGGKGIELSLDQVNIFHDPFTKHKQRRWVFKIPETRTDHDVLMVCFYHWIRWMGHGRSLLSRPTPGINYLRYTITRSVGSWRRAFMYACLWCGVMIGTKIAW